MSHSQEMCGLLHDGGLGLAKNIVLRAREDGRPEANALITVASKMESDWLELKTSLSYEPQRFPDDHTGLWLVTEAAVSLINWCGGVILLGIQEQGSRPRRLVGLDLLNTRGERNEDLEKPYAERVRTAMGGRTLVREYKVYTERDDRPAFRSNHAAAEHDQEVVLEDPLQNILVRSAAISFEWLSFVDENDQRSRVLALYVKPWTDQLWPYFHYRQQSHRSGRYAILRTEGLGGMIFRTQVENRSRFHEYLDRKSRRRDRYRELSRDAERCWEKRVSESKERSADLDDIPAESLGRRRRSLLLRDPVLDLDQPLLVNALAAAILGVVILFLSFLGRPLSGLRDPLSWSLLAASAVAFLWRINARLPQTAGRQAGGWAYVTLLLSLQLTLHASSCLNSTAEGGWLLGPILDPTLRAQWAGTMAAIAVVSVSSMEVVRLQEKLGRWIGSYVLFLGVLVLATADSDVQSSIPVKVREVWKTTNALAIVLFLVGAIVVLKGASIRLICLAGALINFVPFAVRVALGGVR